MLGEAGSSNVQGEAQKKLDVIANATLLEANEWGGNLAAMASEEMERPTPFRTAIRKANSCCCSTRSTAPPTSTSMSRSAPSSRCCGSRGVGEPQEAHFLQPGTRQVAAGYAVYGPSTVLVLTVGDGVACFTLDREIGSWWLTTERMHVPEQTREFAINASNARHWQPPVKRYVDELLAGSDGPRGVDFNMRWVASMVADVHRILSRGGIFMYPRDDARPGQPGKLRLLYEANPMSFLVEQAGGAADQRQSAHHGRRAVHAARAGRGDPGLEVRGRARHRVSPRRRLTTRAAPGWRGQRRGPLAAGAPVLAPAARGCPAMLTAPAAPRNSLRSLRELRSDNRGESEVRGALRAPAGTAALLGCAQARPRRAARAFAVTVAVFVVYTPSRSYGSGPCDHRAGACNRRSDLRLVHRPRCPSGRRWPGGAMSAAPSSAVSGSARAARFVLLTRGDCPSGASAARAASFAARPRREQRRVVGAQHRPSPPSPRPAGRPRAAPRPAG